MNIVLSLASRARSFSIRSLLARMSIFPIYYLLIMNAIDCILIMYIRQNEIRKKKKQQQQH